MAEGSNRERVIDSAKLIAWYDFQAPFYHFWRDRYNSRLVHKVASIIDPSGPKAALDAGCGTGLFTIGLARLCKQHSFDGVDRSERMIEVGRKQVRRLELSNVSFRIGDVEALPFAKASFDAVIAAGLFCNLNEPCRALGEFARVLKESGQVIIVEFDRNFMTWDTRMFFNTMIAGYKIVSSCFTRFRFAETWDINTSTISEEKFKEALLTAGFDIRSVDRLENHVILHCRLHPRDECP
jgi:ubiquinone/menaquinone biosynthesis C-methylase UbiE